MCGFHRNLQGLKAAYVHADIIFISVNLLKYKFWKDVLYEEFYDIQQTMDQLIQKLYKIDFIKKDKSLIVRINIDDKADKQIIHKKVIQHDLKFKYQYDKWCQYDTALLLQYLCDQHSSWELNSKTLKKLYLFFQKKHSLSVLIQKCNDFGCEYMDI